MRAISANPSTQMMLSSRSRIRLFLGTNESIIERRKIDEMLSRPANPLGGRIPIHRILVR